MSIIIICHRAFRIARHGAQDDPTAKAAGSRGHDAGCGALAGELDSCLSAKYVGAGAPTAYTLKDISRTGFWTVLGIRLEPGVERTLAE